MKLTPFIPLFSFCAYAQVAIPGQEPFPNIFTQVIKNSIERAQLEPKNRGHFNKAKTWYHSEAAPIIQQNANNARVWVTKEAIPSIQKAIVQIPPAVKNAITEIDLAWTKLEPEARKWFENEALPALSLYAEEVSKTGRAAKEEYMQFDWATLPKMVKDYVQKHPWKVAYYVVAGILFIKPEILFGPILFGFGWTSIGPAAASFASALQSAIGSVAAGSLFATLQSAGMGGYGAMILANLVRLGVVAGVGGKIAGEQAEL